MTSTDRATLVRLLDKAGSALSGCAAAAPPDLMLDLARMRDGIARYPIPWAVTLHVAYIDHRHGANVYAAPDRAELMSQLGAYCRLWWSQINDADDPESLDDDAVVRRYFEKEHEEYLMVDTIELPAPEPDDRTLEIALTLVLNTVHIAPSTALLLDQWAEAEPDSQPISVADTGVGWFLPSLALGAEAADLVPADPLAVIAFARSKGCRLLLLDRDGPEIEGLGRHAW
ncbi:MAG TPA: hypothetical protein VF503_25050 [Sphingobium sp.]|uniref:DUF5983 family protein n=1 Tax=Sphingobium sp. TaxID=1912891 RepID=UPI002ED4852B